MLALTAVSRRFRGHRVVARLGCSYQLDLGPPVPPTAPVTPPCRLFHRSVPRACADPVPTDASTPCVAAPPRTTKAVGAIAAVFRSLSRNKHVRSAVNRDHFIDAQTWEQAVALVRRAVMRREVSLLPTATHWDEFDALCMAKPRSESLKRTLTPWAVSVATEHFNDVIAVNRRLRQSADLRLPQHWYPAARGLKRRIIYHHGGTNSGKTHTALQRLKAAHSGVYCGPLRLLALEVHERLNADGIATDLITGQEKKLIPDAKHVSCTVETVSVQDPIDVAVIDEVQLIGDDVRGWAWTRALLGLPAEEIHLCGSPEALGLVQRLVTLTGDSLEIKSYQRLSPLSVAPKSLDASLGRIHDGDCVIAFSRKDIHRLRRALNQRGRRVCVVYGALPPETRSAQARLFNDEESGYDVLVASDAVGMGLNLNIRRIVFSTLTKYNGSTVGPVPSPLVKQIAGRAGRYGSRYAKGVVTTLFPEDLSALNQALREPLEPIEFAGLFPSLDQLELFASCFPEADATKLSTLLDKFVNASQLDDHYFMCRHTEMKAAADMIEGLELSLADRFTFCQGPFSLKNPRVARAFVDYASVYAEGRLAEDVGISLPARLPHSVPSPTLTAQLETTHQVLEMYLWLKLRFPECFVVDAAPMRDACAGLLEEALDQGDATADFGRFRKRRNPRRWTKKAPGGRHRHQGGRRR